MFLLATIAPSQSYGFYNWENILVKLEINYVAVAPRVYSQINDKRPHTCNENVVPNNTDKVILLLCQDVKMVYVLLEIKYSKGKMV